MAGDVAMSAFGNTRPPFDAAVAVAARVMRRRPPARLGWDWGEGLFLYALARTAERAPAHLAYVDAFFAERARRGVPRIDWSDRAAPGLAALELFRLTGDRRAREAAERVADYVRSAPPLAGGTFNHFGRSRFARVYPSSAWVDSLMMVVVFAARFGALTGDARLTALASRAARAFAAALHDDATDLWKHAYYPRLGRRLPEGRAAWLRGNGWAVASFAELLHVLPPADEGRAEIAARLVRTARALAAQQDASGLWPTLLGRASYLETSGSALVAWGILAGARAAALDPSLVPHASRALDAVVARLEQRDDGLSLPDVSAETMPYPAFVYPLIPRVRDRPYAVAALLLAADEASR